MNDDNTALEKFNDFPEAGDQCPIERLRYFCSLAMDAQDWLDSEKFFDDIEDEINQNMFGKAR